MRSVSGWIGSDGGRRVWFFWMEWGNVMSLLRTCLAGAGLALTLFTVQPCLAEGVKSVKITAIVEHPALDAVRQGAIDALAKEGFVSPGNVSIEFQSAQGETAIAGQIAKKFAGDAPDVIIAIATPSAQAVAAAAHGTIPIVFAAVSDPVGAKLVKEWERPGANITGVSDRSPVAQHLALIRELKPGAKRIGALFNPGEANSVAEIGRLEALAKEQGMTVVRGAAPDTNNVLIAARALVGKVDVFYVPTDNTVASAAEAVIKVAMDSKTPFIVGDVQLVSRGAAAGIGISYYGIGLATGQAAARILRGEKPGDIPVQEMEKPILAVNISAARKMGLTIPQSVLDRADQIIE